MTFTTTHTYRTIIRLPSGSWIDMNCFVLVHPNPTVKNRWLVRLTIGEDVSISQEDYDALDKYLTKKKVESK